MAEQGSQRAKCITILKLHARGKNISQITTDLDFSRNTVASAIKRSTADIPKGVREKPVRIGSLIGAVNTAIEEKEDKATVSRLPSQFAVPKWTMGHLIKADLGLNVYKRTLQQALSMPDMEKRLGRTKILLNVLKKNPADVSILFLDQTPFSLGEIVASDSAYFLSTS